MRLSSPITWLVIVYVILGVLTVLGVLGYRSVHTEATVAIEDVREVFLLERLALARGWIETNQREDGSLPYAYNAQTQEYGGENNVIRQMITVQGLYALGRELENPRYTAAAARAETYMFDTFYRYDSSRGFGYMVEGENIKLGAAALAVLATREGKAASAPLSARERALLEFILAMQRNDGSFQTFLQDEPTDLNDRFYSGEALTALARAYQATGDRRYAAALERSFSHYLDLLEENYMPQYAAWHMQAYTIFYEQTKKEEYATFVYSLADRLIEGMLDADIDASSRDEGRFFNPEKSEWGPPHSSSTGIYTEGLTYAYELAMQKGDADRGGRYAAAIRSGTRYLLEVQWTAESAGEFEYSERLIGALKRTPSVGTLRIDQTGHALNAFGRILALKVLK